ncbi:MAG: HAD-IIB family hydrolase, partial [Sphingobacterium sp.]
MMLLATDLDGTFLGGKMEDRLKLYRLIKENKDILLVFVTGRGIESVIPLLNDPIIPTPHYIIADVGATVSNGHSLEAIEPIQGDIESKWPSVYDIQQSLSDIPNLHYQDVPQQRRCSYYYDQDTDLTKVYEVAEQYECDIITSVDKYIDLLPKGVNKGSTLIKLIEFLQVPKDKVLVAGDTLNDLSLFEIGVQGVAVGKSEKGLVEATRDNKLTFQATKA